MGEELLYWIIFEHTIPKIHFAEHQNAQSFSHVHSGEKSFKKFKKWFTWTSKSINGTDTQLVRICCHLLPPQSPKLHENCERLFSSCFSLPVLRAKTSGFL